MDGTRSTGNRWEFSGALAKFGPAGRWTGVEMPFHVPAVFGTRARVAVRGTFGGVVFRAYVVPCGDGSFFLLTNQELRHAAGVEPGDTVHVVLERDALPAGACASW